MGGKYDWEAYYRKAFEKEKKKNTVLAGKIADAEAKEADLAFKLARIQNNVFWKVSAPARKCYHVLKEGRRDAALPGKGHSRTDSGMEAEVKTDAVEVRRAYGQEVFRQKHPYLQWIAEKEGGVADDKSATGKGVEAENGRQSGERLLRGCHMIEPENMDLCIVVSGYGMLDETTVKKAAAWFQERDNCLFAYPDEDYYWKNLSNRMHPWYKPCWSPDTMLSFCYMGHMIIVRKSRCLELLEEKRGRMGSYADFYDLCLRLEEQAFTMKCSISHMEEMLFHNCYEPDEAGERMIAEATEQGKDVLETVENLLKAELEQGRDMTGCSASFHAVREAALRRRGIRAGLEAGAEPDIYHVVYEVPERGDLSKWGKKGMVSVVIPSKDHPEVLEKCLSSFREKTEYENYEWIIVDNGSAPENRKRMEELQEEYGFLYLYEPMEFNFSAMCNLGAARARGEYLLFLNDDIEIIEKDWLRIMTGQAGQPQTGAVGAKLWYAGSDAIQHAGITNLMIGPSHKLITFPDDRCYYYGRNQVTYDVIGVTAACLLIERKKYQEVDGFEESMKVAYNDVDFCFKLIEAGYYNVLRNDAVLYHNESLSRGLDEQDDGKWERLLHEKENLYARHPGMQGWDGFYHKSLIDNASRYACNFKFDYENNLKTTELILENAGNLAKAQKGYLQLTIDRAEEQHKIHLEEPDIMFLMGWSYLPGEDNAKYKKSVVFQRDDGSFYRADPNPWCREDVEAVLSGQVNISLSGFTLRIKKENLHSGIWRIGMLATDVDSGRQFLTWSDKEMVVK
ncbi:MAG: glycosyltransferase family 2 protein [Lachnospiraceae bacterium]|nr:glycosyltransferase family 2 protein [Lachnospiraceae bacterium]